MLDGLGWIMHQEILAIVALNRFGLSVVVVVVLFSSLPLLITWKMCTCPLSFPVLYPWHCFQIFSNIIVVGTCSLPLPLEVGTIDGRLTCAHGKQKNSGIGTIDLDVLPDPFWCLNWCPENWSYQNRSSSEPTLNISCPDASDLRRLHPLTY